MRECIDCGRVFCSKDEAVCPKCQGKKKWRTIKACRELAAKYREPEGKVFFSTPHCPLCVIHDDSCSGCPLSHGGNDYGCLCFDSCDKAQKHYEQVPDSKVRPNKAFNTRAAFFDKIIPILEGIPASRFTKWGWKYFDMLDRSW